ncbi:hypothetical protein IMZ31_22705 (plasmid) [Pontibacillus sp. ALD_SL1]|uniref:hypothetical protein n=1 Tax=Pontibacillus sp. ALD_SL1 TaxID=2777185 RepID=UPI001A96F88A|nr:hypothetical protein [Pontibacillus sp. ALD_SL1]QST02268.1 hypothetical protein IMZ31_22705 [Pontibacillus sp. ALD_SL1]
MNTVLENQTFAVACYEDAFRKMKKETLFENVSVRSFKELLKADIGTIQERLVGPYHVSMRSILSRDWDFLLSMHDAEQQRLESIGWGTSKAYDFQFKRTETNEALPHWISFERFEEYHKYSSASVFHYHNLYCYYLTDTNQFGFVLHRK